MTKGREKNRSITKVENGQRGEDLVKKALRLDDSAPKYDNLQDEDIS